MDRCKVGEHDFESYVVATIAPDQSQLTGADIESSHDSQKPAIIQALTAKRCLVACSKCGLVLGGFGANTDGDPTESSVLSSD
jgi:hypothetical protein